MPGICGLAWQSSGEDRSPLLAEMVRRLKHYSWYNEGRHLDGSAGIALARTSLGITNPGPQPALDEGGSLCAVMEGELYDFDEQRAALAAKGIRFTGSSHADLLLHGYKHFGKEFFRGLNGMYVAAIWDARRQQLILTNDRFGMKPLYYTQLPGRLLIASEIKALLADPEVSRRSNARGIAQFFTFGQLLGEDTLLEAVRLLPAAGWLTYDVREDRLTLDRYWQLEASVNDHSRPSESLDRVADAFQRAVQRRVCGARGLGISLSGGLDSRTILAAIDTQQIAVTTFSSGIEGCVDHRCAEEMARLAGCKHFSHMLDLQFLASFKDHMQHMVHLTDGHYLDQCIVLPTLPVYRELGIEVLLRGHAGELMHMDKAYNFSLDAEGLAIRDAAGLESWLSRHLRAYMLEAVEGNLFLAPQQDEINALALDSLRDCLKESAAIEPPLHRLWHLFMSQRSRRETAQSMVLFSSLMEIRLPFLDNDLIDALMAAPPELKVGETMEAHILRRHRPAFLNVVNANTGTRVGAGRLRREISKFRLKVLRKLGVRGYQHYEQLGLWLRREFRPLVQELLLSDRCLERGVFNPETVRTVVQQHWNRQRNHTYLLMAMMIFELGQRTFIDQTEARNGRKGVRDGECSPVVGN